MQLLPGLVELLVLLFADDIILMGVSQSCLQKQLDCLQEACEERNLEVNCDKAKIKNFRKKKKVVASKNVKSGSYMVRDC